MAKKTAKAKPPKTIQNDTLGALQLSSVLPAQVEYSVDCDLGGNSVEITLYSAEGSHDIDATIALAGKLVRDFAKVQTRLQKYVSQTVLKKINASLRADDPLSRAEFLEQIELTLIDLHANGDASFWYSPSEALLGHGLVLYGTSDGAIRDFDTPG